MSYCTTGYSGYGPYGATYRYGIGCGNGGYGGAGGYGCGPCGGPYGTYGCGTGVNYGYNTCYGNNACAPRNISWRGSPCGYSTGFSYGGYC